jgi:hypothetical protein
VLCRGEGEMEGCCVFIWKKIIQILMNDDRGKQNNGYVVTILSS